MTLQYMEDDVNDFHREDWFFAQLTYYVYLIWVALGGKGKREFKDLLLKFQEMKPKEFMSEKDREESKRAKMEWSKAMWSAAINMAKKQKGKPKRGHKGRSKEQSKRLGINPKYAKMKEDAKRIMGIT